MKVAVVGLGKMGMSHLAILRAHPEVEVAGVCDSSSYALSVLEKYTGIRTYSNYGKMLAELPLDAVLISTPSKLHADMVREALNSNCHVFCEKPFCLAPSDSRALGLLAESKKRVTQVGYHNRFAGTFGEVHRLIEQDAIGDISHVLGEAYGPVVLKSQGSTWRSQKSEGGGCLYDYAAHPIDLVNWYMGKPQCVEGSVLNSIFSRDTDDEVYSTLKFSNGASGQLSVNWSDESCRKMSTKINLWGRKGRIYADRQECQVFLREDPNLEGYRIGWNVRYTTELTQNEWFYLRGEEYSAQVSYFIESIMSDRRSGTNSFASASEADEVLRMIVDDSERITAHSSRDALVRYRPISERLKSSGRRVVASGNEIVIRSFKKFRASQSSRSREL